MAFWSRFVMSLLLTALLLGLLSWAAVSGLATRPFERFRTSTYEFALMKGWRCQLDGTEYVCFFNQKERNNPAILVAASKVRGPNDTFEVFSAHLRRPQTVAHESGEQATSKILRVGRRRIGRYEWVEGIHDGSELPNFRTYYYATVTSHLAVLITLSAHRDHLQVFEPQFEQMIRTMRIFQRNY